MLSFLFITWYAMILISFQFLYWKTPLPIAWFPMWWGPNGVLIGRNVILTCSYFVTVTKRIEVVRFYCKKTKQKLLCWKGTSFQLGNVLHLKCALCLSIVSLEMGIHFETNIIKRTVLVLESDWLKANSFLVFMRLYAKACMLACVWNTLAHFMLLCVYFVKSY